MRGFRGKDPQQAVKFQLYVGFRGKDEMTEVRRVERAAKKTDLFAGHEGSISFLPVIARRVE
jgi:hypothetical protein